MASGRLGAALPFAPVRPLLFAPLARLAGRRSPTLLFFVLFFAPEVFFFEVFVDFEAVDVFFRVDFFVVDFLAAVFFVPAFLPAVFLRVDFFPAALVVDFFFPAADLVVFFFREELDVVFLLTREALDFAVVFFLEPAAVVFFLVDFFLATEASPWFVTDQWHDAKSRDFPGFVLRQVMQARKTGGVYPCARPIAT